MAERYFVESPIAGGKVALVGQEAHHLAHVMRARRGERVVLFDGSGWEYEAQVERVGRSEVELAILNRQQVNRELPFELTLATALPKGDRQRWLVEKAVELGVTRLVPLSTTRLVVRPSERSAERLRRTVIEASKQCGRNKLMEIAEPQAWPRFVAATQAVPLRLVAHPANRAPGASRRPDAEPTAGPVPARGPGAVVLAVGPEGGFTPDEAALAASAGWTLVDLGPRTLRVETAAVLLAAMVVQACFSVAPTTASPASPKAGPGP